MKTDKELLELAAKAAGCPPEWNGDMRIETNHGPRKWNPLTDDGDAFRLAVKLHFNLDNWRDDIVTTGRRSPDPACWPVWEIRGKDEFAATRRAIVRAAAKIGETL